MSERVSWLKAILESTKSSEAPERYFWWAGLSVISATVRNKVFLDRYHYKLYPNIYVMLVSARSGLRKGVPISMAKSILEKLQATRVISGHHSIQAITKELSQQITFPNGLVLSDAHGIFLSDEFAASLVQDPQTLTILTQLHNTHEHESGWRKVLKGSPVEELKSPCVSMLVASNEALFDEMVKSRDMEGGFIARTFIIHESKRKLINPLVDRPEGIIPNSVFAQRLEPLKSVKGEMKWTPEAANIYVPWYTDLVRISERTEDRTGSLERLGDQAIKVAMLVSLAKDDSLLIQKDDMEEAIQRCEECFSGVKQVSMGAGKSQTAPAVAKTMKLLLSAPENKLSRKKILQKLWPDCDAIEFDRVVETLHLSGAIKEQYREGKEIMIELKEEHVALYRRFKSEEE